MSLKFKSFIKTKFLFLVFIPSIILMFGIVIYLPKDRVAKAAVTLNPDDKVTILLGKSVYVQNCASCHGTKLEGQKNWVLRLPDGLMPAPPHDETGHTWHHSEEQLYNIIRYGLKFYNENYEGKMQGNDKLSDEDVWSILAYIKSVWPESIQKKYKTMTKH